MKSRASKLDDCAEELREWFRQKVTLKEAQGRLQERGIAVSMGRLSQWLTSEQDREREERLLASVASGGELCRRMEQQFGSTPAPATEQLVKLIKVLVMQVSASGQMDNNLLKLVGPLMGSVLEAERLGIKRQELAMDERRVRMLEEKASQARAVAGDTTMSAEEKAARMKEIFGLG